MYSQLNTKPLSDDLERISGVKDKETVRPSEEFNKKRKLIKDWFNSFISQNIKVQNNLKGYTKDALFNLIVKINAFLKRNSSNVLKKQNDVCSFYQIKEKCLIKNFGLSKELFLSKTQINLALAEKLFKALHCIYDFNSIKDSYLNKIDLNAHKKVRNSIIDFLTDDIKELLYSIILESKNSDLVNQAASNAITLLNKSGFSFTNKDLSRIKVPNADLSCGLFINTNFESSYLFGVNFSKANIYDSNFRNCNMLNANFGVSIISGFKENIEVIKFSPCGRFLAIVAWDKIYVYNAKNYQEITKFMGDKWKILSLLFSDNGEYLASCVKNDQKNVFLWDTSTMLQIAQFSGARSIDFSPCNNFLCLVFKNKPKNILKVFSIIEKRNWEINWLDQNLHSAYFLPSGEKLIAINKSSACIWNLSTKTKLNELAFSRIFYFAISLNRKYIAIVNKGTYLYRIENLEKILAFDSYNNLLFSPCGRYLNWGKNIYDLWKANKTMINALGRFLGFFADEKYLITERNYAEIKKTLKISFKARNIKNQIEDWEIQMVSFSQDSQFFALLTHKEIIIFFTENQKFFKRFHNYHYPLIVLSNLVLASAADKNTIKIWYIYDESTYKLIQTNLRPRWLKFSPDGKKIAVSDTSSHIDILDIDSNLIILKLSYYWFSTNLKCHWSCSGAFFFAASCKKYINIWLADSQEFKIEEREIKKYTSINISFCGSYLISAGIINENNKERYIISVWDLENMIRFGKKAIKVKEILVDWKICSVLLSPNGDRIIAGNKKGEIIVWDYISGKIIKDIKALPYGECSIDFLARENFIISKNGSEQKVKLWKFDKWYSDR